MPARPATDHQSRTLRPARPSLTATALAAAVAVVLSMLVLTSGTPANAVVTPWSTSTKSLSLNPSAAPYVTAVRVGRHTTYDRVIVDLSGLATGWTVGYVGTLYQDGSGAPVDLRGPATLRIALHPANAHTGSGASTLTTPARAIWYYPQVLETRMVGDFEAVVTVGVGLDRIRPFRVMTLSAPTRLVIDVLH